MVNDSRTAVVGGGDNGRCAWRIDGAAHGAGVSYYLDLVWNHSGFSDYNTAGFYNSGYESFWNGLNYVALLAFAAFVLVVAVEGLLSPAGADQVAPAAGRPVPTT